ncbi:Glycosyltransferase involved in cell wall bisynthesis [Pelagirhabdus alkalitolerans]|uniref:Glycosyltransferase involved in cell wall bisynthesis n=1 Tax=Pelagirhabdus alkalitolerans TaxID=1612202 RepID=A0A1G6GGJ0_9BACI|nr:glycosyltransferase family 2 protein [Pelagirhabdus alkalitolerans]SDB81074.1 Glycosyltransferase involved in cell wall bisynthesis [Pelagirhabdus alkalitolerans]
MNAIKIPITVLMSVYNGEGHLEESIKSILNQTFKDFCLLIINDASSDHSLEIIESFKDNRIKLINNESNIGLTKSLNKGLKLVESRYIARMDSDDIAHRDRLKKQYEYMENNQNVDVLGAQVYHFFNNKRKGHFKYKELSTKEINARLLVSNPIMHPTAFIRLQSLLDNNIKYDESLIASQDYGLWLEIINKQLIIKNLSNVLLYYRVSNENITNSFKESSSLRHKEIFNKWLSSLGFSLSDQEILNYTNAIYAPRDKEVDMKLLKKTLFKISQTLNIKPRMDHKQLKRKLGYVWLKNVIFKKDVRSALTIWGLYGIVDMIIYLIMKFGLFIKNYNVIYQFRVTRF